MALALTAMASIVAGFVLPSAPAYASSVPAPTLVSPANNTTTPLKDVVLVWNPVPGASLYQVQVSPNNEWTNNPVTLPDGGTTVNTVYEVPISLPHGSYFWHVRAQVDGVWSSYSPSSQFLRDWPNTLAILRAPTSVDPTVEWAPVSEASEYVVSFVDISNDNAEVDCTTEQTSFTPYVTVPSPTVSGTQATGTPIPEDLDGSCFSESNLVDGDFYIWGIEAYDDTTAPAVTTDNQNGDPLACASAGAECTGYVGDTYVSPDAFQFLAPNPATATPPTAFDNRTTVTGLKTSWHPASTANGTPCSTAGACPVTPTFSWDPTPGANFYKVDVYLDPLHSNDYRTYTTAWPELTPRDFYLDAQAGAQYYWTVQPGHCGAGCSAVSAVKSCTAAAGAGPAPSLGPVTDSLGNPVDPLVDGFDAGETYDVSITLAAGEQGICVIPSSGTVTKYIHKGNTVEFDWQAPPAAGTVTFEVVTAATNDTTISATVNAGVNLRLGIVSAPATFGKRSGPVTLTSPVDGATLHGGSVTFKWASFLATGGQTALEARNYRLEVGQDPNFDTTVIDDPNIDLTQYTDPASFLKDGAYYWRVIAIDESGQQLTWSPTRHFTVDATTPTVSFLTKSGVGVGHQLQIQTSSRLTGVTTHSLKVVPKGKPVSLAVAGTITKGATSKLFTFTPTHPLGTGVTYVLVPTPSLVDGNGNPVVVSGGGVTTALIAKATGKGWKYSHGWHRTAVSSALSGYDYYASAGQQASLTVGGAEAHLFGCMGPDFGKITVSVAGHAKTISEHQKFTSCGVELWHRALPDTSRKLTVSVVSGVGNIDEVQVDQIGGAATGGGA